MLSTASIPIVKRAAGITRSKSDLRGGFTLVELLVVVAIIALLLGILVPTIGKARRQATILRCTANLKSIGTAMTFYLEDSKETYPAGWQHADKQAPGYLFFFDLLGKEGTGHDVPTENRPLNPYLDVSDEATDVPTAECPLDKGVQSGATQESSVYDYYGSSYIFGNRQPADIDNNVLQKRDDLWLIEGHKQLDVLIPSRKALVTDQVQLLSRSASLSNHHWHNDEEPLEIGILFADGHSDNVPRKTEAEVTADGDSANSTITITQAELDDLASEGAYY